jgi:hypothetical protein
MAVLTKGLTHLRSALDSAFPSRDRSSDGWIGDAAHLAGVSGHNPESSGHAEWTDGDSKDEVRAIDVDSDLGNPRVDTQMVVDHIRGLPNVASVIWYIIYDHRIYVAPDFKAQPYEGAPHTEHIHVSGARSQSSDENTTFNWRFDELLGDNEMSVDEYFASVAKAVRGDSDATGADRNNRNNFAIALRFGLGYNWNQQQGDDAVDPVMGLLRTIIGKFPVAK